jgi:hypothetical protein
MVNTHEAEVFEDVAEDIMLAIYLHRDLDLPGSIPQKMRSER